MTATTTTSLPKNKTGLFAGDTLQDVKSVRNQPNTGQALSLPYRHNGSANISLISTEQNRLLRNGILSGYPSDRNNGTITSTSSNSCLTTTGIRNGFRPSTLRRQKSRVTTTMTHRDNNSQDLKDISTKPSFTPSPASARLKSEIDQLNNQLKIYGDLNKILRLQNNRDMSSDVPQSALSYSISCRLSSASTNHTAGRIHQRFSSALTSGTLNTLISSSRMTDTSNKSVIVPSSPFNEEDDNQHELNSYITHAYQIPQQSNVGSESIFPLNPSTPLSKIKTRSTKNIQQSNGKKPILCPFYVMYFTNLAMQQGSTDDNRVPSATTHKRTVNSRISTSYSRHQSSRRQVHSPISMNTYSTTDDDNDSMTNKTTYYNNKRFSAKMAAFENENSHMLKDILRTTSWNHVQV